MFSLKPAIQSHHSPLRHKFAGQVMRVVAGLTIVSLTQILLPSISSPAICIAQYQQPFADGAPTWTRHETDCQIIDRAWVQRRGKTLSGDFGADGAEQIQFQCGPGTRIMMAHPVTPAFIIPELTTSVRLRSNRPGVQLSLRVVLPHTPAPNGEGPMTTLVAGPELKTSGQWEVLEFGGDESLTSQLQSELWMLRGKFGSQVTLRDAYVDRIVLNLYTGPGISSVEIDELQLNGIVEATRVSQNVKATGTATGFGFGVGNNQGTTNSMMVDPAVQQASGVAEKRPSIIKRDGTVLLVRKRPFFARVVEHNGENFNFLKSLGFNTIELRAAPTAEQLQAANQLDLWLVSPPPASVGLSPIGFEHDRVLAWSLGRNLTGRDLSGIQQRLREIRESDQRENRPTFANVKTHWSSIAASADILSVGTDPLGTGFMASQYGNWIKRRSQSVASTRVVWADVQTEMAVSIENQARTLFNQLPPTPIELQQSRFIIAEAITAGARGLRFRSRKRLDSEDPVTRLRALTCQYNNRWLDQLEPWVAGGAVMGEVNNQGFVPGSGADQTNGADQTKVTAINTNRARLLFVQRPTHREQYWAGDQPLKTISITDSDTVFTSRVYQLTDTDIKPLSVTRKPGGTEIKIPDCPYLTTIVMTEDPVVVNRLMQSFQTVGQRSLFDMHTEITRQWLAIMQLVDQQMARVGRRSPESAGSLNEAVNAFRTVSQMSQNSPTTALPFLDRTDERLAFSRRAIQGEPLGLFPSKTATPLVAHCSLVALHWDLANQLSNTAEAINGLAGGDFENLELMTRSGWENHRDNSPAFATQVELSKTAAYAGQYGLKLAVASPNQVPVESPPVWVTSPKIRVRSNQLVRIHGWVNVSQTISGSVDGLRIVDTLGTPEFAERIPVTRGWQEFTLYRSASEETDLRVTFELHGTGTAMIDEVTIRTIDLTNLNRQAHADRTAPASKR